MPELNSIPGLIDHLFRQEAGKMVAILSKIFGIENLETAEDVVQQTFMDALGKWEVNGIPDNPPAWLFRVAKNKAIDVIRRNKHSVQYEFTGDERILLTSEYTIASTMDHFFQEDMIKDDMLRMMFTCCHPELSTESQITLVLKTLCGFTTLEIARAFLSNEETITKRLYRAKEFFRQQKIKLALPAPDALKARTQTVLNCIYLLFNEGYSSTHHARLIREDLLQEAMMLGRLLAENMNTQVPEVFALLALMCFHVARNESRLTPEGEIILLPEQDRSKWDRAWIQEGNRYMNIAAFGEEVTPYHIEAAIAYEHCVAETFEKTNWKKILSYYEWLCRISPSPITELNKVVAIMEVEGAEKALEAMLGISERNKISQYYLYPALLGELYTRLHQFAKAKDCFLEALELTTAESEIKILKDKLAALRLT